MGQDCRSCKFAEREERNKVLRVCKLERSPYFGWEVQAWNYCLFWEEQGSRDLDLEDGKTEDRD